MSDALSQLVHALRRPAAWPFPVESVVVRETHISVLFLVGDRAYKLKKPVDLGFLDFTDAARRRFFCLEEVRLNRRLAHEVYLGVADVVRDERAGFWVRPAGAPPDGREVVEALVEMRRLPEERMLDRLLDRGEVSHALIDAIVEAVVEFHGRAPAGPDVAALAAPDDVRRATLENLEALAPCTGDPAVEPRAILSPALLDHLRSAARSNLDERRSLLEARVREGRVREGHGDLHAANICCTEGGVVIYDCIEFSRALRCGDVAREIAFLLMDLGARGERSLARHAAWRYAKLAHDDGMEPLLPFYEAHLACVRAKVHAIGANDASLGSADRARERLRAMRYAHFAASLSLEPFLAIVCGLPGTGKSTVAAAIARPLGAAVVRSDVIRKRLAGLASSARPAAGERAHLYSSEMTERTYARLVEEAAAHLRTGRSAVIDATCAKAAQRAALAAVARRAGAPWVVVHVTCPEEIVAARLASRAHDSSEPSDADWLVYERARENFEPPAEITPAHLVEADGRAAGEDAAATVIDRLIPALG